ncbi:MAG: cupin domain-containing protein [Burkholderiales bacterium]
MHHSPHFLAMPVWRAQQHSLLATLVLIVAATLCMTRAPILPQWNVESNAKPNFAHVPPFILCGNAVPGNLHDPLLSVNADGSPRPVAQVVSSEPLAHAPGKRITIALVNFAPGAWSPPHVHGGTVNVWVLKGTIRSQLNNGPMEIFQPGGTFFEPIGGVHSHSGNVSTTEEAQVLAIFVHEEGATLTTYLQ